MTEVASRELRNDTAGVLRRAQAGEDITVTVNGKPVARLTPVQPARRRWLSRDELVHRLQGVQADPGLHRDLAALAGETTDDLGPTTASANFPLCCPTSSAASCGPTRSSARWESPGRPTTWLATRVG